MDLFLEAVPGRDSWFLDHTFMVWFYGSYMTCAHLVQSESVALLFLDTRPVDATVFHHDLLGADDPKCFFPNIR